MKRLTLLAAGTAAVVLLPGTARAAPGPQVWASAGCGGCHTLQAAGSSGSVGPNLDYLRPSSAAVAAQVARGGGGMPSFGASLSGGDIQALAAWVSSVAGTSGASSSSTGSAGTTSGASGLGTQAVKRLQRDLAKLGFFHGPVTGFDRPLTTAAVKRFQRSAGLSPDGLWGPRSAGALRHRLG